MKSYSRMEVPANDLIKVIKRYQHCIQQINPAESDPQRVLHYLRKLSKLPVRLDELEKTGIGKTINALRKADGNIAEEATLLVAKWKSSVKKQVEDEEPAEEKPDPEDDDRSGDNSCVSSLPLDNDTLELVKSECDSSLSDRKSKYESSKNKVRLITIKRDGSCDRKRKHSEEGRERSSKKEKLMKVEKPIFDGQETIKEEPVELRNDADLVDRSEKRKDSESERKSKDHEKRHHKSSKHRDEKSHRDKHKSHQKHESDDRYDSHKHRRDKKSKTRDKVSKRDEDRKSSKESSETERGKKTASRDVENHKSDEASGDFFGAALLGIPVTGSPKKKSTSSKSSNYQDSPPNFSSPKSNQSLEFLSNNIKLEPLSKDLDIYDEQDYAGETYITPSKYSNSKQDEHLSPSHQPQKPAKPKGLSEEDMFSSMTSMKNRRTKVYHGFKVNSKFPTLFELCVRILQDNFDALEYTGGVPYEVLKPILEKVTVEQLYTFENFNPYLIGETDELWEHHAKKDFRKAERQEYETWRDLYLRCVEERQEKLQSLTENISQSMANSTPVRKTKLAYVDAVVKPPRNVARQQAKHGTGITNSVARRSPKEPQPSPAAIQSVKERLAKEASSPNAIQIPTKTMSLKKKAAPLMQKTLQLFKGLKR